VKVLGLSCFYHDSAAALVIDGRVVAAAQEERFTRKKHDPAFPFQAAAWALSEHGLRAEDLDAVAYYEDPKLKLGRILWSHAHGWPANFRGFAAALGSQANKYGVEGFVREALGFQGEFIACRHHLSHAASAFYPSPFPEAAFLTMDGVGERDTTTFGVGEGERLRLLQKIEFPHSLGLLYSAFTYYTGFKINSGEYKLMGLAPYGEPKYAGLIRDRLVDVKPDGSFRLDLRYFSHFHGEGSINEEFERLFGRPRRKPEGRLTQFEMDVAASIQEVLEEIVLKIGAHVRRTTGKKDLCLAGGVALNCVSNGKLLRSGIFDRLWIQPASGDAGGALGAALYVTHELKGLPVVKPASEMSPYLGPSFDDAAIQRFLDGRKIPYRRSSAVGADVARLLAEGGVIGWFQGPMEFGPRALGNRSIIGDARSRVMQKEMNLKIKYRESFRPFAPSVLRGKVKDWFEFEGSSPYMLIVAGVAEAKRRALSAPEQALFGIEKLNTIRSEIPAVTHVDYSARIQTVDEGMNPRYHELLAAFEKETGCPVIVNTSFNVRGEPIVMTPEDAYRCFMRTEMNHLVLGDFILDKKDQPAFDDAGDWRKEFELD
jgi:carbamoyltransferase